MANKDEYNRGVNCECNIPINRSVNCNVFTVCDDKGRDTGCTDYTVFRKKTPTYVFDYNSGVSWSIFILFVPVEREMNTLQIQFTHLQS